MEFMGLNLIPQNSYILIFKEEKMKMKKVICAIIFICILACLLVVAYRVLSWKDTSGDYLSTTKRLYSTEENTMDVVFAGSSHCYCSITPSILWEQYGISGFVMATSGQDRESTYYHIKEVLKTQNPKVIVVELGSIAYDGYGVQGNLYRNMLSMKLSKNNVDLINASVDEKERFNYIIRWPIIHTRYSELEKYDFVANDFSVFGRGEGMNLGIAPQTSDPEISTFKGIVEIPQDKKEWIDRLIQLSKDEDFDLVFYLAPFYMDINQKGIYNAITKYLEKQDISFMDFTQSSTLPELNYATDFVDDAHTNAYGAEKITGYMGRILNANYELEDHRGDADYQVWDQDAAYCKHFIQAPKVKGETDWDTYASNIANEKNWIVIISLDGDYKKSTIDFYNMLASLHIEDGYQSGGKWVIEDGEVIKHIPGDDMKPFIKDLGEDVLKVQNVIVEKDPAEMFATIMIDNEEKGVIYQGLTVMIYDTILHELIDVRGYY